MLHETQMTQAPRFLATSPAVTTTRRRETDAAESDACGCGQGSTPPDDAVLVAGCLRGEAKSWEALVKRYQRLVFTIVRRMRMDEHMAADVFQTVFSRLFTHLPRIADPTRLQAWIVTTAKREALLQLRHGERTVSMTDLGEPGEGGREWDMADGAPIAEEALDHIQQVERVRRGLDQLDPRCRSLMEMLFCDEDVRIGYGDVADKLNMAIGSIGPTRARCLDKLRKFLD